jgi:hypothetical protein
MVTRQLKLGFSSLGIAIAIAVVPAGTAFATSHHKAHHTTHHTKAATTGAASCPAATLVDTAAGTTYSGPTTQPAAEKDWVVCEYSAQGEIALMVSLYTKDDPLRTVSANAAATPKKVSGIGNAASHYGTIVFVQRDSAPSFSVIDESGNLTLSQTEAVAKAIVAG